MMLRSIAAGLIAAVVSTSAIAQELTVEQAKGVVTGLRQLSKYETVDKDGKPATGYYKFSGTLRFTMALNIETGTKVEVALQAANVALVAELANGGPSVPDDKMVEYNKRIRAILDAPCRCTFEPIKRDDLKLDDNPIPPTVLALLLPILER